MSKTLILATGSKYKKSLFGQLGIPFEAISADIDESRLDGEAPLALAQRLAMSKAQALAASDRWVIGADQVIALDGRVFNKPGSAEQAVAQLLAMRGKTHQLITAMAAVGPGAEASEYVQFDMKMRRFTEEEARTYVEFDMPVDCAGSYKIESGGIRLFESMNGDDFTAIIGLALTRVRPLLIATHYFEAES